MGRGRAKAKQTKVARKLKYDSGGIDLDRLRRELGTPGGDDEALTDQVDADRVEAESLHQVDHRTGETVGE